MKKGVSVVGLLVVFSMLLLVPRQSQAAISCGQVTSQVAPCLSYLTSGGTPSGQCCSGVKNLAGLTTNQADRRAACSCLKSAAAGISNLKPDAAANLPSKCGVSFGIPISANTNCNTIP